MAESFMMNVQRTRTALMFKHILTYGIEEMQDIINTLKQKSLLTTQSKWNVVYDKLIMFNHFKDYSETNFHTLVAEITAYYELDQLEPIIELFDSKWVKIEPIEVAFEIVHSQEMFRDPNN